MASLEVLPAHKQTALPAKGVSSKSLASVRRSTRLIGRRSSNGKPTPAEAISKVVVTSSSVPSASVDENNWGPNEDVPETDSNCLPPYFLIQAASPSTLAAFSYDDTYCPSVLATGTDVSAKYKGAFCEAKIKKIIRLVKCRVTFKQGNPGSAVVTDDNIKGTLRVGALVEAKYPEKGVFQEATINKIIDASQYTVVFDDGDETTLRRTSLCLKSGKHFAPSESLDHLPLTNPEHFCNPVNIVASRSRRSNRKPARGLSISNTSFGSSIPSDVEDNESAEGDGPPVIPPSIDDEEDSCSNLTQQSTVDSQKDDGGPPELEPQRNEPLKDPDWGKVVCVEYSDKRGTKAKDVWFPSLVVSPAAQENNSKIDPKEEYLVRSFKDGRYYQVAKKESKDFDKAIGGSSLSDGNISTSLKSAIEKALHFAETDELPSNWDYDLLLGNRLPPSAVPLDAGCENDRDGGMASSEFDSAADEEEEEEDNEPSEEKDRFVAQLYKFMDERGTPINKGPSVCGKDLDLYQLFRLVNKMGGYNRVTNKNNWRAIFLKMNLPTGLTDSSDVLAVNQLKLAYKKFLLSFNDFHRKLGCSFTLKDLSAATTSRTGNRPSRTERNWRGPEKELIPAKTRRKKSLTGSVEEEKKEDVPDIGEKIVEDEEKNSAKKGPKRKPGKVGRKKMTRICRSPENDGGPEMGPNDGCFGGGSGGNDGDSETDSESEQTAPKTPTISKDEEIAVGDRIRVKYGRGKQLIKVYEAKILKAENDSSGDALKKRYFVHYTGWNVRYDEWIKRNRIVEVVRDKSPKRRGGNKAKNKGVPLPTDAPGVWPPMPPRRGRPPSATVAAAAAAVAAAAAAAAAATGSGPSTDVLSKALGIYGKKEASGKGPSPGKRARHRSDNGSQETVTPSSSQSNIEQSCASSPDEGEDSSSRLSREDSISSFSNVILSDSKKIKTEPVSDLKAVTNESESADTCDETTQEMAVKEEAVDELTDVEANPEPAEKEKAKRDKDSVPVDKESVEIEESEKPSLEEPVVMCPEEMPTSPPTLPPLKAPVVESNVYDFEADEGEDQPPPLLSPLTPKKEALEEHEKEGKTGGKRKRYLLKGSAKKEKEKEKEREKEKEKEKKSKVVLKEDDELTPKAKKPRKKREEKEKLSPEREETSKVGKKRKGKHLLIGKALVDEDCPEMKDGHESRVKKKRGPPAKGKSVVVPETDKKDASPVKKRTKREVMEEMKTKKERENEDEVNLEIARLFDEPNKEKELPKDREVVERSSSNEMVGEGVASFLLCKEEVPVSPVQALVNNNEDSSDILQPLPETTPDLVRVLTSSSPDISAPNFSGFTPLFTAQVAGTVTGPGAGPATCSHIDPLPDASVTVSTIREHFDLPAPALPLTESSQFTPPTTPESVRSGTLSSLTPPHEPNDSEQHLSHLHTKRSNPSSNNEYDANEATTSKMSLNPVMSSAETQSQRKDAIGSPPQVSEDSCSRSGPPEAGKREANTSFTPSQVSSPKKRRRGRTRTSSVSETAPRDAKERSIGCKTRGATVRRGRQHQEPDRYSPIIGNYEHCPPISPAAHLSSATTWSPNAALICVTPSSKYNFCTPIDENLEAEGRIQILQDRLQELKKTYLNIKSEVALIERRRKKAKKKGRHSPGSPGSSGEHCHSASALVQGQRQAKEQAVNRIMEANKIVTSDNSDSSDARDEDRDRSKERPERSGDSMEVARTEQCPSLGAEVT